MDLKKVKSSEYLNCIESLTCPKCRRQLVGAEAVRLQSGPRLTPQMQKLLKKQNSGKSLTQRQQQLLHRALQHCAVLVLRCGPCQWQSKVKLQSREAVQKYKARLRHKAAVKRQQEREPHEDVADAQTEKMVQKKLKKKEKRKKVAEAKAKEIMHFKSFSRTPTHGTENQQSGTSSMSSTPSVTSTAPSVSSTPSVSTLSSTTPASSTSQESSSPDHSGPLAEEEPELKCVTPVSSRTPKTAVKSSTHTHHVVTTPCTQPAAKTTAQQNRQATPHSNKQAPQRNNPVAQPTPQTNKHTAQQTPHSNIQTAQQTPQSNRQTLQSNRTLQSALRTPQSHRGGGVGGRKGGQASGKQQLRKVLQNQQKTVKPSAGESLAQFIKSLK